MTHLGREMGDVRISDKNSEPQPCDSCGNPLENARVLMTDMSCRAGYHPACAGVLMEEEDRWWLPQFELMTKGDDSLGSAGWMVGPSTVRTFIQMVERRAKNKLS